MNQYAERLLELQARPSHKLKEIGDQWQTPKPLAWGLFHHFAPKIGPVVLDLFADMSNALVGCFYTAADNALLQDWAGDSRRQGGACFANPPYSRPESDADGNAITGMESILDYCRIQRDQGAKIMLLIKAATSDGWWPEDADCIQFISGRIGFEAPNWYTPADPVKDKPSSSGFASAVVIFDRDWKWERRPIERLNRDDLITTGEIILGMIDYRAAQLVSKLRGSVHTQDTAAPTETVDNLPDASQATVKEPKPVCVVRIYQSISGDWAAEYLQNNVAMASIGGCDTAEDALAAADDQGWVYDHISWPHDIESDDESNTSQTNAEAQPDQELEAEAESVTCIPCGQQYPAGSQEAEFIGWHGKCPSCELQEPQPEQEAEPSVQLDMMDASYAAGNDTEPASVMPLADWHWQYQNDGPLSLDDGQWPHFVVVLTILYGVRDQYTSRQVAVACSICDEQLMDEFTTMSDETKERIRRCSMAIAQAETDTPMTDEQRQTAVTALLASVDDQKLSLKEAELIARSAVLVEEVAASEPEDCTPMPLEAWQEKIRNDDTFGLAHELWPRFVVVLTILYGVQEQYTFSQVAKTCSMCNSQRMNASADVPEATKRKMWICSEAITQAINLMRPELTSHEIQESVSMLMGIAHLDAYGRAYVRTRVTDHVECMRVNKEKAA